VAIASLVALAFLIPLALLVQQLSHERALAQAERQTAIVVSVLAVTTDPNAVEQVIASTQNGEPGRLAVHGLAAAPVGTSHAAPADIEIASQQRQTVVASVPGGLSYLEPIEVDNGRVAVVEVHVPHEALEGGVLGAWWALAVVAAGLVIASAVVGDRLANRLVRPARQLADAATALGDGDLDVRVVPSGPRELAEAGFAFNQMADRLVTLRIAEREMVADLSHRLRTPLTGLRLDVEALEAAGDYQSGNGDYGNGDYAGAEYGSGDYGGAEYGSGDYGSGDYPAGSGTDETDRRRTSLRVRQALATLEHEIDVLIRTTRQAVAAEEPVQAGHCDASQVVGERLSFWSAVAADQERPCEVYGTHSPAPVGVPASELAAALDAVLGNAFRYTPQGTALEVAVSRHDGWVAVRVDDAGEGIADPDRALRRGASDRGSTGLGLDIARRVAQAGGGSVSLGQGRLGGASVVMLFADAEAPPPEQPSRRGLIGRLTREPRRPRWPRPRHPAD
jgi:signal transduction histidine kinase